MLDTISQPFPAAAPTTLETRPYSKRQQLLQALLGNSELLLKNRLEVRHLMTPQPVVIPPTATLEEMTALMTQRRLHHLLVCNRGGELLGVVSDRDLHSLHGTTAQQLMSFPALSCAPDTPVGAAITYLINENISCLPVVENKRPVGMLTMTDLVLTLQCTLQLWMRLAQVLQHDSTWPRELEKIAATLDGAMNGEELAGRITAARRAIHQEVQDLINMVDLRCDVLTGMSNRGELEEILNRLLAVKKRHERPFSLAVVAIDYFARIRENCGDEVIKPLLKAVARLVKESVRESDFVAHYRDDAFAVVLAETRLEQAGPFCRRLRDAARQHSQLDIDLRISTGAVEATPSDDVATLLSRAEAAVE